MRKQVLIFGLKQKDVVKKTGLSWSSVWQHANGRRRISPKNAIIYNKTLGIPLEQIRPDIWGKEIINNENDNEENDHG